jgi:hypothetical protein
MKCPCCGADFTRYPPERIFQHDVQAEIESGMQRVYPISEIFYCVRCHKAVGTLETLAWGTRTEPDTSDIPEASEDWFRNARLVLPREEELHRTLLIGLSIIGAITLILLVLTGYVRAEDRSTYVRRSALACSEISAYQRAQESRISHTAAQLFGDCVNFLDGERVVIVARLRDHICIRSDRGPSICYWTKEDVVW